MPPYTLCGRECLSVFVKIKENLLFLTQVFIFDVKEKRKNNFSVMDLNRKSTKKKKRKTIVVATTFVFVFWPLMLLLLTMFMGMSALNMNERNYPGN